MALTITTGTVGAAGAGAVAPRQVVAAAVVAAAGERPRTGAGVVLMLEEVAVVGGETDLAQSLRRYRKLSNRLRKLDDLWYFKVTGVIRAVAVSLVSTIGASQPSRFEVKTASGCFADWSSWDNYGRVEFALFDMLSCRQSRPSLKNHRCSP